MALPKLRFRSPERALCFYSTAVVAALFAASLSSTPPKSDEARPTGADRSAAARLQAPARPPGSRLDGAPASVVRLPDEAPDHRGFVVDVKGQAPLAQAGV